MSFYRQALREEAFGIVPTIREVPDRDEEALPLAPPRPDGVYFHMQDRVWRVRFGGADRFETFHIEDYDGGSRLLKKLKEEAGEPQTQD